MRKKIVVEDANPLTEDEIERLEELEIDLVWFDLDISEMICAGRALAEINERRLYRAEHKTFEKYVTSRNQSRSYAYELMNAAKVSAILSDASDIQVQPSSMSQIRCLFKLKGDAEKLIRAWTQAVRWALEVDGGQVTIATINRSVQNVLGYQRRRSSPKAKPALYHQPKRMAKYIIDTMGREYASRLCQALMPPLDLTQHYTGVAADEQSEAVS